MLERSAFLARRFSKLKGPHIMGETKILQNPTTLLAISSIYRGSTGGASSLFLYFVA
jgi:hypothetical protein